MFSFAVACVLLSVMQSRVKSSGLTLAPHPVASHLLLISTLARLGDSRDQAKSRETVAKVAEEYLGRDWRSATEEKEKGDIFNTKVEKILTVFLASSRNVVGSDGGSLQGWSGQICFAELLKFILSFFYSVICPSISYLTGPLNQYF